MNSIPNEESHKFTTAEGRVELMQKYGGSEFPFSGVNEDGEAVLVSIGNSSMTISTNQSNGWVRVNYYGADGEPEGETFNGKWRW